MLEIDPDQLAAQHLYDAIWDIINTHQLSEHVTEDAIMEVLLDLYHPAEMAHDDQLLFKEELASWVTSYFLAFRGYQESLI